MGKTYLKYDQVYGMREVLTAARTYYVRTDGNDANTGLVDTAGGAFLTIQHAIDIISIIDFNDYTITIYVRAGTFQYADTIYVTTTMNGLLVIEGDSISTTILETTSADMGIYIEDGASVGLGNMQLVGSGDDKDAVYVAGDLGYYNVDFHTGWGCHLKVVGGYAAAWDDYEISGDAGTHVFIADRGKWFCSGHTITLTDIPTFWYFLYLTEQSYCNSSSCTWDGSATGGRFFAGLNSAIQTWGSGLTYFPGNFSGNLESGSNYDSYIACPFKIGDILTSVDSTNPDETFPGTTWAAFGAGRVLVGLDSEDANFDVAEETGGAKTVASSAQTMSGIAISDHAAKNTDNTPDSALHPSGSTGTHLAPAIHQHNITAYTHAVSNQGTLTPGAATSVVQPYIVVYMWKRTA
jgi:hypothetical protein